MNQSSTLKRLVRAVLIFAIAAVMADVSASNPKREFRGAWMQTVFQDGYRTRTTEQNKQFISSELDKLKAAGINAVIFQVRPQSDAFYDSQIEPWSRFLTDGGKAPVPYWDPLKYIIDEAHARGMELHAWLNPYRVTSTAKQTLPAKHIYHKHPERFVRYGGKLYFDPGQPENMAYIKKVVADIVKRYDVDGIHMDDYFYPYPDKGKVFGDSKSFARYGKGLKRGDWRRDNVNRLVKSLNEEIKSIKPWVRFGISPFGIWRNKANDPRGSETRGLQNYDALYADVLLWAEKGWVDYLIPQIYWDMEHPMAPYGTLVDWWNKNCCDRDLYIGQNVDVTMNKADVAPSDQRTQLASKIEMTRTAQKVGGNCWWPASSLTKNVGGVADSLSRYHQSTVALPPAYPALSNSLPEGVSDLNFKRGVLSWSANAPAGRADDCIRFVVYRFDNDEEFDLENAANIVAVTPGHSIKVDKAGYYVVTALDRVNNESLPSEAIKIKP